MKTTIHDEYTRVMAMLSRLTVSVPFVVMTSEQIAQIERESKSDQTLATLERELLAKLRAIKQPEDHQQMAQAYEVYSEVCVYREMKARGIELRRTPGTGGHQQKRPDFVHRHVSGDVYFEVKALEIAGATARHKKIAAEGLENAAELDTRARKPGVHISKPHVISGHLENATSVERIDATIERIGNTIKPQQIHFGPTVLVVDLGRLQGKSQGPSGLLPVFFDDKPQAESCVTGELWQIALGLPGEHIFVHPEFAGASNIGGHQGQRGILHEFPGLMAITFFLPRWSDPSELLTIWNPGWDQASLQNPCTLTEHEIESLLFDYSDGCNDKANESAWRYHVSSLRTRPTRRTSN